MEKTNTHNMHKHMIPVMPLIVLGFVASFSFVQVVTASGIASSEVISLANKSRAGAGVPALSENEALSQAARAKAKDMIENDYFAHTSPEGRAPWYWMKQAGYEYRYAGENLAINYTNAKDQHNAWMKSKTHKDNILNANYKEIGVAVVEGKIDGESSIVTVELFGTPLKGAVASRPAESLPTPAVKGVEESFPAKITLELETGPLPSESTPVMISEPIPLDSRPTWMDIGVILAALVIALTILAPPIAYITEAYYGILTLPLAKKA